MCWATRAQVMTERNKCNILAPRCELLTRISGKQLYRQTKWGTWFWRNQCTHQQNTRIHLHCSAHSARNKWCTIHQRPEVFCNQQQLRSTDPRRNSRTHLLLKIAKMKCICATKVAEWVNFRLCPTKKEARGIPSSRWLLRDGASKNIQGNCNNCIFDLFFLRVEIR